MNTHYLEGFLKRAMEHGLSNNEALALLKAAKEKPGLWANIRAKRARGEKPAKPGDKDYPDKKQWSKLTKKATTLSALKTLMRQLRAEGVTITKNPKVIAEKYIHRAIPGMYSNVDELASQIGENMGPMYNAEHKIIYIPKKAPTGMMIDDDLLKDVSKKYRMSDALMHEGGHATHFIEDSANPLIAELGTNPYANPHATMAAERIANNNAINFMRSQNVPEQRIIDYKKNLANPGYKTYIENVGWAKPALAKSPSYTVENSLIKHPSAIDKYY